MGSDNSKLKNQKGKAFEHNFHRLSPRHKDETAEKVHAFYVSMMLDSILSDFKTDLRRNFNIDLKPFMPMHTATGPILDIRDATNDDIGKLTEHSKSLEANWLLVVLVPKRNTSQCSERLVVLRKSEDLSKQGRAVDTILQFIKNTWKQQPSSPIFDEMYSKQIASVSQDESASGDERQTVHYALDRHDADFVLQKAVDFIAEVAEIRMQQVWEDFDRFKPLIVFCKNDTMLQDDICYAMRRTRGGSDVMLLVVTDKKGQILVDTEATRPFGRKACLFWNHQKQKFRYSENTETVPWVGDFLRAFHVDIKAPMRRSGSLNSLNRSFRKQIRGEATGSYCVPFPFDTPEEWVKKAVGYFHDKLVVLEESLNRPLVLLTADKDGQKGNICEFLQARRLDSKDVLVVVLHRGDSLRHFLNIRSLTILGLCMHELKPEVLSSSQNGAVAKAVKQFLNQKKAPEVRDGRGVIRATTPTQEVNAVGKSARQPAAQDDNKCDGGLGEGGTNRPGKTVRRTFCLHVESDRTRTRRNQFSGHRALWRVHSHRRHEHNTEASKYERIPKQLHRPVRQRSRITPQRYPHGLKSDTQPPRRLNPQYKIGNERIVEVCNEGLRLNISESVCRSLIENIITFKHRFLPRRPFCQKQDPSVTSSQVGWQTYWRTADAAE